MKAGGQILWNASPICETSQIYFLMGRRPMRYVLGNPFKGPIIPFGSLVEYYPITAKDQSRIHQFGKRITWIVPRICFVRGENLEGWRTSCRLWGVGNDGSIWNLLKKTQCKESNISQRKWKIYPSNRRWTNQTSWRRSRLENIHLDAASTNSRRKSRWFSWRIRRVSSTTSRLISGWRWSDKWFLVHLMKLHIPPSRWTKGQTLLAERRIIPYFTEIHWRIQNYSYEFGCYARKPHRWLLEYRLIKMFVRSLDRFHSMYSIGRKTSRRIYIYIYIYICGPRGRLTRKQLTSRPDHLWPELCEMKNSILITHENCEGSISSTLRTRNLRRPSRMLVRNWKHQWLPLCLARQARKVSSSWPT